MTINATAATLLCLYVAVADERGVARDKLSGTIQNDILKEYIARGTYIYPPRPRCACAPTSSPGARARCRAGTPSASAATTSARPGATPCRRSPSRSPTASPTSRRRGRAGLPVDDFAPRLSFFFNAHANLLEEVAKFRAARRLWARIMRERFGAKDPQRADAALSRADRRLDADARRAAQQRRAHHHRGARRACWAARSRSTPTATTRRWRCRPRPRRGSRCARSRSWPTRAASADVVDPLGGAYAIEALTSADRGARRGAASRRSTGAAGWSPPSRPASRSARSKRRALAHQRAVESGARVIVGVNRFNDGEQEAAPPLHRTDPTLEAARAAELARCCATRVTPQRWATRSGGLRESARGSDNLFPPLLVRVKARATLGEIADVFREIFGEYRAA